MERSENDKAASALMTVLHEYRWKAEGGDGLWSGYRTLSKHVIAGIGNMLDGDDQKEFYDLAKWITRRINDKEIRKGIASISGRNLAIITKTAEAIHYLDTSTLLLLRVYTAKVLMEAFTEVVGSDRETGYEEIDEAVGIPWNPDEDCSRQVAAVMAMDVEGLAAVRKALPVIWKKV